MHSNNSAIIRAKELIKEHVYTTCGYFKIDKERIQWEVTKLFKNKLTISWK